MAVEITGEYTGTLNVRVRHGPSRKEATTAAPVDNHGDGSSFSPTDLVATALGSCVLTVMAIAADEHGIPFDGATFRVEKHMAADPRRIDTVRRQKAQILIGVAGFRQRPSLEEQASLG